MKLIIISIVVLSILIFVSLRFMSTVINEADTLDNQD